jgi:hypothetical protein
VTGGSGDDEPAAPQPPALRPPVLADPVRRRLDEIFGEVLPEVTGDEKVDAADEPATGDEWLRANRPPHHGG